LPIGGSSDEELGKIGLRTDTRPTNPHFGDYRPAIFPEGWDMRPVTPEPDLDLSSFATIFNGAGEAVAEVMWRQTGTINPSYVCVIEQTAEQNYP